MLNLKNKTGWQPYLFSRNNYREVINGFTSFHMAESEMDFKGLEKKCQRVGTDRMQVITSCTHHSLDSGFTLGIQSAGASPKLT